MVTGAVDWFTLLAMNCAIWTSIEPNVANVNNTTKSHKTQIVRMKNFYGLWNMNTVCFRKSTLTPQSIQHRQFIRLFRIHTCTFSVGVVRMSVTWSLDSHKPH